LTGIVAPRDTGCGTAGRTTRELPSDPPPDNPAPDEPWLGDPVANGGRSGWTGRGGGAISSSVPRTTSRAGNSRAGDGATKTASGRRPPVSCGTCASVCRWTVSRGSAGTSRFDSSGNVRDSPPGNSSASPSTFRRIASARSSSSELECVFLSPTPNSGRMSRITLGLTSSSRASSLMRILLIRSSPAPVDAGFAILLFFH
jgi:hypothetical protein